FERRMSQRCHVNGITSMVHGGPQVGRARSCSYSINSPFLSYGIPFLSRSPRFLSPSLLCLYLVSSVIRFRHFYSWRVLLTESNVPCFTFLILLLDTHVSTP